MKERKLFGIGLDGATYDLLLPWFEENKLPNLAWIYHGGAHGHLESTTPPLSPLAWTSFMTGKNPGKHGIYDFTEHNPGTYDIRFTNAGSRKGKSLWKILSESGKKVGVVNVPMTFPAEEVNGVMISGFDAPGVHSSFVHPPDLYEEMKKNVGEYDIHGDFWTQQGPEQYLERILRTIDNQAAAVKYLLSRDAWDFFFVVFGSTDRVQHFYWKYCDPSYPGYSEEEGRKYGDAIYRVYEKVDEVIGEYLELIGDDADLMVMSDHGAGPYYKIVYLDQWLSDLGLMAYRGSENGGVVDGVKNMGYAATKEMYLSLRKYLPRILKDWLKARLPDVRHKIETHLTFSKIDWSRTKAFPWGIEASYIFINKEGFFPQGIVSSGREYEELRDLIITGIRKLKDPETGEGIVENVFRREDLYKGESEDKAPDLIIMWKNSEYITRQSYGLQNAAGTRQYISKNLRSGEVGRLMSLEQTGAHRMNGVFMFRGSDLKKDHEVHGAGIMDIAPTILYYMGLPVPSDMDGNVLMDIFEDSFTGGNTPVYTEAGEDPGDGQRISVDYTAGESHEIEERLRNLGYLE